MDTINVKDLSNELITYTVINSPDYKPDKDKLNQVELTEIQIQYIDGIMNGKSPKEMREKVGISKITPYLWKKQSKLFAETLDLIEQMQADDLESSMWAEALSDEASNPIVKMFLLKGRKPLYRENAAPPTSNTVSVHVTVAGEEFKVVADATPDED